MNKVILMGRLTRDPDVRYSAGENATAIAKFSIAVDRRVRRQNDQADADFFNCTAFGRQAEFVERYLHKGTKIVVVGRIQNDNYTNREGQRVFSVQIIAEELEFAESKNASEGYQNRNAGGYQAPAGRPDPASAAPMGDDLPGDDFMNVPDSVADIGLPFN